MTVNKSGVQRLETLGFCTIVKNESANLARCLTSVQAIVDELVLVDTGSTDDTVALAKAHGAKVTSFEWVNDFAAARNFSLSQVKSDWILSLDADEELVVEDSGVWQFLVERPQVHAYAIERIDLYEQGEVLGGAHLRLFRNLPGLRYQGRYHEQLIFPNPAELVILPLEGIKILHYGNSDEQILTKNLTRDIPILEEMRREGSIDLWRLDCLARKYLKVNEAEKAQDCYQEALDILSPNLMGGNCPPNRFWMATLLDALGSNALGDGDLETARLICLRGLEWFPTFPPLNYLAGEFLMGLEFPLGAIAYFNQCLELGRSNRFYRVDPFPKEFMTTLPAHALACAHQMLGNLADAIAFNKLALSFDPNHEPSRELRQGLTASQET
jgi:tetratricopeptide (TPR) repeat protein